MDNKNKSKLSPKQTADLLQVGVTTVKQWVDKGILPAEKTAGGHRRISLGDLLRLSREGIIPSPTISKSLPQSRRSPCHISDLQKWFLDSLLAGDTDKARNAINEAGASGYRMDEIADDIVQPSFAYIGRQWEDGRLDIFDEHRATQICMSALYDLRCDLQRKVRSKSPRVVGGAVANDPFVLPSLLAEMVLLDSGWQATNLGPNTPFTTFHEAVRRIRPKMIWLSASVIENQKTFVTDFQRLFKQVREMNVAMVIGGRAFTEDVRSQLTFSFFGDRLGHFATFAETLNPTPRLRKRGRPKSIS